MRPDDPAPSLPAMMTSWLELTRLILTASFTRADQMAGDAIKDAIMDIGCQKFSEVEHLPGIDIDPFVLSQRERVEATLRQAVELLNAQPQEYLDAVTRDQIHSLFTDLADEIILLATRMRLAVPTPASSEAAGHDWGSRYRRMMSGE